MKKYMIVLSALTTGCGQSHPKSTDLSLTDTEFYGKKYYFGFAEQLDGSMGQETRFDVKHTNDIFASNEGGDYQSNEIIDQTVNVSNVRGVWDHLHSEITSDDMYVQYSSGHGSESALGIGLTYSEIRDRSLALGAKETILFLMACHSGGLTEEFDRDRARWSDFAAKNKTLFVMASSTRDQLSSTGPGTDHDEPAGVDGSAGSAFGHALWKALLGYADGAVDGLTDGFLTLGEIEAYTKMETLRIGGHTPVTTGIYDPEMVMAAVPSRTFRSRQEGESAM